jgi:hypothetical protein
MYDPNDEVRKLQELLGAQVTERELSRFEGKEDFAKALGAQVTDRERERLLALRRVSR